MNEDEGLEGYSMKFKVMEWLKEYAPQTKRQKEIEKTIGRIESIESVLDEYGSVLSEAYLKESGKDQLIAGLGVMASIFGTLPSDFAYLLPGIVEDVPEAGFDVYNQLVERAFSDNSITNYHAERFYNKLVGLIDEHLDRIGFLKSVLKVVDKEVCTSIKDALPHDHPYLKEGE